MNNELLQAAKDQAAQYYGFKNYDEMVEDTTPDDKFINRAMEIYAEKQSKQFAEWIAQNCRMYENEFSLYNLNEDVLEIRPVSELYELFNLFKPTKP